MRGSWNLWRRACKTLVRPASQHGFPLTTSSDQRCVMVDGLICFGVMVFVFVDSVVEAKGAITAPPEAVDVNPLGHEP